MPISDQPRSFAGNLDRWRETNSEKTQSEPHCFSCSSDEYIISAFDKSLVFACANIHFTPLMTSRALQFKSIPVENVRHRSISKVPLESLLDRIQLIPFQRRRHRSRRCNARSNTTRKCSLDRWTMPVSRSRTVSMISERWWIRNDRNRKFIPSPCAIFGFDWNRFNCSNRRNWWPCWTCTKPIEHRIKHGKPTWSRSATINRFWPIHENLVYSIAISLRIPIHSIEKLSPMSVWWCSRTKINWDSNWMVITTNVVIFWLRRRHPSIRIIPLAEESTILYSNRSVLAR